MELDCNFLEHFNLPIFKHYMEQFLVRGKENLDHCNLVEFMYIVHIYNNLSVTPNIN